ncbi:MAG: DinB family protein [Acidobacteriia bacterium]|nr:DinB family protein [Terriglobia bacterium]
MTSEQAVFLMHATMGSYEFETPVTAKVIAAIPEGKSGYQPDPKAKTAKALAWHIVASEEWFLRSMLAKKFEMGDGEEKLPEGINTIADIGAYAAKTLPPLVAAVKNLGGAHLTENVDFFGMMNRPCVTYLGFLVNHSIHHRGQLSTYLRPMGSKVPVIYGGSADEPFQGGQ